SVGVSRCRFMSSTLLSWEPMMKQHTRGPLLASCTAAVAFCLVTVAIVVSQRAGRAQAVQPAGIPAPRFGGNLPVPDQDITITWDPRFRPVARKASLVGQYLVIEGDMVIGTVDDARKAELNELVAKADRLRKSVQLDGLGLTKSEIDLINQVADLPQQK